MLVVQLKKINLWNRRIVGNVVQCGSINKLFWLLYTFVGSSVYGDHYVFAKNFHFLCWQISLKWMMPSWKILFKLKAVFNVKGRPVNAALMLVSILCLPPRKVRTRFCHILVPHVHVNQWCFKFCLKNR